MAFSALVVGHAVFLSTVAELFYFPIDYLRAGPSSGLPANALAVITAVYVTLVTTKTFGGGWKSSAKGLLAIGWAGLEQVLVQGIVIGVYFAWIIYARLGDELSAEGTVKLSPGDTTAMAVPILLMLAVSLVPFALHAGWSFTTSTGSLLFFAQLVRIRGKLMLRYWKLKLSHQIFIVWRCKFLIVPTPYAQDRLVVFLAGYN